MFSIISSLYNSERYLENYFKALKKFAGYLLRQQIPFEIIIIANSPTEKEKAFGKKFLSESWLHFLEVGRETLYASWNRGVSEASGEFVGFWNVDDVRYAESLKEASELFKNGIDLVYFPFIIKRYLNLFGWSFFVFKQTVDSQIPQFAQANRLEFARSMFCGPHFIFKKSLYKRVGPFDEQFKVVGDFDWCVRAAKSGANFKKAKSLSGEFRVDGKGLSSGGNSVQVAENNIVYMRSHAWDKMQVAEDLIIKKYRPKYVLHQNSFVELKAIGQIHNIK